MPDISVVHVDLALTEVLIAYKNNQYVADELFPVIPVNKQSNKYFIYSKDRFRVVDDARRPGARANEFEWNLSTDTYYTEGHALAQAIPDELRANADPALDIDVDTTEQLIDSIYLQRELLAARKATDTTVITQYADLSQGVQWSDYQNSNPVKTVEDQKATIQKQIAKEPNSLLLSKPVFLALRNHPAIIDRFKYTQVGILQPEHLKAVFNVENLFIADTIKNVSPEGATDSLDYVWGKHALLFYRPDGMGRRTVSLGGQFRWLFGANTQGYLVKRYRVEERTADVVECQLYYDLKIIAAPAAYLFLNAVA
jgi:hypothetical protein